MAAPEDPTAAEKSQADGTSADSAPAPAAISPQKPKSESFSAALAWSGAGDGCGTAHLPQGNLTIAIGGARALGGRGTGSNPEELLLAAIGSCFINTWAVFLNKLKVSYAQPTLRVAGTIGNDPAGGYRVTEVAIHAQVPSPLLVEDRAAVQKTLTLAEKYCIVSRAVKASVPIRVEIEEV